MTRTGDLFSLEDFRVSRFEWRMRDIQRVINCTNITEEEINEIALKYEPLIDLFLSKSKATNYIWIKAVQLKYDPKRINFLLINMKLFKNGLPYKHRWISEIMNEPMTETLRRYVNGLLQNNYKPCKKEIRWLSKNGF